jgi:Zn-finger nucleic acid-binding protein
VNCPRCERHQLVERERDGIEIDVCSSCRGVWLDRGELDKLIARANRPDDERRFDGDDDDDDRQGRGRGGRRGFFASIGDIFD